MNQRGTTEWFEIARRDIVDSVRAVQSMAMARTSVIALAEKFEQLDMTVHQALLNNLVINYCRPFVSNRAKDGATRTYPLRLVAGADGFDRDIHAQLLELRHKMVAHSDDDYLDARFTGEAVVISKSDDPSSARKVPVRVGAITIALWGLSDKAVAERYRAHVAAAVGAAEQRIHARLKDFFEAAVEFPTVCPALAIEDESAVRVRGTIGPGEEFTHPMMAVDPAILIPPVGRIQRGDLLFQTLKVEHSISGNMTVRFDDGGEITLALVKRGASPPAGGESEAA